MEGATNEEAINKASNMVIFAVPWDAHNKLLESLKNHLKGKILIDIVVPLSENDPKKFLYHQKVLQLKLLKRFWDQTFQ